MAEPPKKEMIVLRPGTSDDDVYHDVFVRQFHVPPAIISPQLVLDLGCNVGLTMLHYSQLWPTATIIGVELNEGNVKVARQNTTHRVINAAVAGISSTRYYKSNDDPCAFRLLEDGDQPVTTIAFAELLDEIGIVDFVKMDIEGTEWEVLRSCGWEAKVKSLLVEVHNNGTVAEMINLLSSRGFDASAHTVHWSSVWAVNRRSL